MKISLIVVTFLTIVFFGIKGECGAIEEHINDHLSVFTQLYVRHARGDPGLNEKNDIFGIKYDSWMAATFVNSLRKRSYFVGYDFWNKIFAGRKENIYLRGHLYSGLLYGYGDSPILSIDKHRLVASPTIEVGIHKGLSIEGLVVPDPSGGTVISVLKYNF